MSRQTATCLGDQVKFKLVLANHCPMGCQCYTCRQCGAGSLMTIMPTGENTMNIKS